MINTYLFIKSARSAHKVLYNDNYIFTWRLRAMLCISGQHLGIIAVRICDAERASQRIMTCARQNDKTMASPP